MIQKSLKLCNLHLLKRKHQDKNTYHFLFFFLFIYKKNYFIIEILKFTTHKKLICSLYFGQGCQRLIFNPLMKKGVQNVSVYLGSNTCFIQVSFLHLSFSFNFPCVCKVFSFLDISCINIV